MEQFDGLLADLDAALKQIDDKEITVIEKAEQSVLVSLRFLNRLKAFVMAKGFANDAEEILFFKHKKPLLASKLFYFAYLMKLETGLGFHDKESLLREYKLYLRKLARFNKKNKAFIYYYRSGNTALDDKFFKRSSIDIKFLSNPLIFQFDPNFSTSHDHKVAKLLAKEALAKYISNKIETLLNPHAGENGRSAWQSPIHWTGSGTDYAELMYGLTESGRLNNGNIGIGAVDKAFQKFFNIKVDNISRKLTDLKDRKNFPTRFLDFLVKLVRAKINGELPNRNDY